MMASPHFKTIIVDALTVTLFEVLSPLLQKSVSVQDVMPLVSMRWFSRRLLPREQPAFAYPPVVVGI
jgi:hypothetical protein